MRCNSRKKKQIFFYATSPLGLDTKITLVPKFASHRIASHRIASHRIASHRYNSARNNFSGYPHFKSNSQKSRTAATFSLWKTAHDIGQFTPFIVDFLLNYIYIGEVL